MRYKFLILAFALVAPACATGGQGDRANRITIVVTNEYTNRVTAYAVWEGGRNRLGEVSMNRTRRFSTVRRGDRVALGLEVQATPSPGTTPGRSVFGGGGAADPSSPFVRSEAMEVATGEGIEWQITSSGALAFRRLPDQGQASPPGQR